jgi:hypothetical protein
MQCYTRHLLLFWVLWRMNYERQCVNDCSWFLFSEMCSLPRAP